MEPATIATQKTNESETIESEMIRRGIAGDADALHTLFSQHSRRLYCTALRVVGSPEEAEEVLQEAMLNAFRNLHRFEGRSQFSTWLTRIVVNAALMRVRGRKEWHGVSPRLLATARLWRCGFPTVARIPSSYTRVRNYARKSSAAWNSFHPSFVRRSCCAKCRVFPRRKRRNC